MKKPFSLHKNIKVATPNSLFTTNHKFGWPNRCHKAGYGSINGIPKFSNSNLLFAFYRAFISHFFCLFTIYILWTIFSSRYEQFSSFWHAKMMAAEGFRGIWVLQKKITKVTNGGTKNYILSKEDSTIINLTLSTTVEFPQTHIVPAKWFHQLNGKWLRIGDKTRLIVNSNFQPFCKR